VEPEVAGLVGRLEAIAVHVVHGAPRAVFVMMHQSVGRARGVHARAQAAADCLDQRGLAAAKLARQPDHGGRGELAAEVLTEPVELVRVQAQGAPHPLPPEARGSGPATTPPARNRAPRPPPASAAPAAGSARRARARPRAGGRRRSPPSRSSRPPRVWQSAPGPPTSRSSGA